MVIAAILAVVAYAVLLFIIDTLHMPDPGPRIAKVAVSLGFLLYMLELFGMTHLLR